jgi:hypothetical protein
MGEALLVVLKMSQRAGDRGLKGRLGKETSRVAIVVRAEGAEKVEQSLEHDGTRRERCEYGLTPVQCIHQCCSRFQTTTQPPPA